MKHRLQHLLRAFPLLLITGLLVSCLNPQPQAPRLLADAQRLMEDHPDSAMLLIDSIFYPEESLSKKAYMDYLVTRVQARYKNYRPVAEDTLLFTARDYFARKGKDPAQTALAFFYSGCVYREQGDLDKAMEQYKIAEEYAAKTQDTDLKGLVQYNMGDLLSEHDLYEQALEKYKSAQSFYIQTFSCPEKKQAMCFAAIGQMYLLEGKKDSAFVSFHKGLDLAILTNDVKWRSLLMQNLSVAYREAEEYSKAEEYLRQAAILNHDTTSLPRYYLNFAQLYSQMGQADSAKTYMDRLKMVADLSDELYFKSSAYGILADDARVRGDLNSSIVYLQKQNNMVKQISEKRLEQSVYEVQQKYDYEIIRNKYVQQMNQYQHWLILLLAILLAVAVLFTIFSIRQKNTLLKTRENIDTLRQMAASLAKSHATDMEQKESDLRELLLWKFDVIKKSALLSIAETNHKNTSQLVKKFHKIVYDESVGNHWESILKVFTQVNKHIPESIKQQYPNLTETEYRICLLSYAEMSIKEIAIILQISPNTVQTYRTALRKKLGIENPSTDISLFLKNKLNA